ncbi:hypothetical protein [Plantibacter sp. M259]|uniref:hypothetical protein n=1 Tax=Plantibacter sp. M259 TaxID=2583822 RepID=UPI001F0CFB36|nr:hypothetical protein [Plantibacter sp. M259]
MTVHRREEDVLAVGVEDVIVVELREAVELDRREPCGRVVDRERPEPPVAVEVQRPAVD